MTTNESNLLPVGVFAGPICDYFITKNSNEKTELQVQFLIDIPNLGQRRVTARKYFTGGALEYTLKFLATVGLKGNDPTVLIDNHYGSGFLDETEKFDVEIIHETYQGKTYHKVGWVNRPGGRKLAGNEAQSLKASMGDLRGAMMQAKKDTNTEEKNGNAPEGGNPPF